ncbi:hypothetical protein Tsubulata_020191 [Turnera subulata]|uniref:WRKY domain-containing protein n=1 Tax=Turnera subulata TaxID=218843 RepID=A0A9Q0FK46_9ROSI|nr:hypothetical protein Tsubulata_020191 [Turnera subulata]
MVSSGEAPNQVASEELHKKQIPDSGTDTMQQTSDSGFHALQSQEGEPPSATPEKSSGEAGVSISQLDKEGSVSSLSPVKVSRNTSTGSHSLQSVQEGRTPSVIREKVSEDGYHWRKYGQKLVKGNEFVRSYYKCTHPSCPVKKQLECSHEGQIEDIVYFGQHEHPKPQVNLPLAVGFAVSIAEERPVEPLTIKESPAPRAQQIEPTNTSQISTVTSTEDVKSVVSESNRMRDEVGNDDDPRSKRQKKGNRKVDPASVDKTTGEPRLVVQTLSEVDIVNDGYRWRKYGQKMVKGSPNPRSYYRCSSPGCPAKKHVERASHDSKVVITSYEGQHDHDMPPSRTITHNTSAPNICTMGIQNGESGTKSAETGPASVNTNLCNSLDSDAKSKKKLKSRTKAKGSESGPEGISNEQQQCGISSIKENDGTAIDIVGDPGSVSEGRSNVQHNGESRTEAAENGTASGVISVTTGLETNPNEQHMPKSEPVQS